METEYENIESIKLKGNKIYVSNKDLLREIKISKERDLLTYNAVKMLLLIAFYI